MADEAGPASGRRWARQVALLLLSAVVTWIVVGLVGEIDWAQVWDAVGRLALWQVPVLLVVLVVRQVLNASPLALFIETLGLKRAALTDQAAIMMSTVAPPPADMVIRLTMFHSWGIPATRGLAGAVMNSVTFYVIRFAVPVVGLVLVLASPAPYHAIYGWLAIAGAAVTLVLLAALWAVLRRERAAVWVAQTAGRWVRRVRPSVDSSGWADSAVTFRDHVSQRSRRGLPASLLALFVMVVVDGLLLSLCVRFVGVGPSEVPLVVVLGVFLVAYPLTLFPLAGVGVLDAVILAALVEAGGAVLEPELVAALVVYRVTTLLVPLAFGAVSMLWWRRGRAAP